MAVVTATAPSADANSRAINLMNTKTSKVDVSERIDHAQHHWRTDDHQQAGQDKRHHRDREQDRQSGCALLHAGIAFCSHFAGNHPQGFGKRRTEAKRLLESGDEPTQIVQTRSLNEIVERLTKVWENAHLCRSCGEFVRDILVRGTELPTNFFDRLIEAEP